MSSRITPPAADTGSAGRRWTLALAGIVVLAIIACAIFLLANRDGDTSGATNQPSANQPYTPPSDPGLADPTERPSEQPKGRCDLPAGDQTIPTTPIHGTQWSLVFRHAVPSSPRFGPQVVDQDGLRRCFAHSPAGAVYAAYNHIVSMSPPDDVSDDQAFSILRRIITAGPDRDAYFRYLETAPDSPDDDTVVQLVGFKVLDATKNRVTVLVAAQAGTAYVSSTWTLVWQDSDWKVRAPKAGERAGDPYTSIPDLTGFVPWRGA